jgi:uncharacterized protein (TIGR03435 family)
MTETLFFVLNHLWQSTLVAAIAWLACRTMLRLNSPAIRFAVWMAACVKFLVPFYVLVGVGHQLYQRPVVTLTRSQQVFDLVTGGSGLAIEPFRTVRSPQAATFSPGALLTGLAAVWALGTAVVLFQWLVSWWRIRRAAREAVPCDAFRGVPVLLSPALRQERIEPGVFGLWRQRILIPEGLETALTPAEFEAVLSHEWSHVQRRDNLAAVVQMLSEAIFWFYPVIWLVGRRLNEERELACDQAVLEHAGPDEVEVYAEGILKVCKLYSPSPLPCAAGITGANLRARVESILKNVRPRALDNGRRWILAAALAVAVAGPPILGLFTAPAASAQQGNSFNGLATSADRKFEVTSVKLNQSEERQFQLGPPMHGSITITQCPLRGLIVQSFRTQRNMVFGIPSWAETESYDVTGKGPDPNATNPEVWEMMRSLLIDRFHLKYHLEDREMDVYALTVGPRGVKLTLAENGECRQAIRAGQTCGGLSQSRFGAAMHNMPIGALITDIGIRAGRPIIDETGLKGRYDANLSWVPDGVQFDSLDLSGIPPEQRPRDMTLSQALEQVGLKLVPQKGMVPVVIVDSVSRPDPN